MTTKELTLLQKVLLTVAAIIICSVVYSNHFHNPFEFDDAHTINTNEYIKSLSNIPLFFKDATTTSSLPANQAYRPGLTTLNAIDYFIGGKENPDPFYYHVSIFISFILLGICFLLICQKIISTYFDKTTSFVTSIAAMLLLLVHTANSATINYIIQRADSFSTFMVLVAFCLYLYSSLSRKLYLYMIPVIIGYFVKEPTIMFIPLLIVYRLFFEQKTDSPTSADTNKILTIIRESLLPVAIIIALFLFSRAMTPKTWSSGGSDALSYILTQPSVILHYFNNFLVPANLVVDTDWTRVSGITDERVITGVLFIFLLLYIIYRTYSKHRPVAFGISWFLITLLPTSLVPLAEVLNDHRPFFGYIGFFIAIAYLLAYLFTILSSRNRIALIMIYSVLIAGHCYGTYQHNIIWQSQENLWKEATLKAPKNPRAWMNYGNTLMAKGNLGEADLAYRQAAVLAPNYSYIYINLGILTNLMNRKAEAEGHFNHALQLNNNNPEVYYYYGQFLDQANRLNEAQNILNKGLQVSPKHALMLQLKATVDQKLSNPVAYKEEKLSRLQNLVKTNPSPDNYLNLSLEYYNRGNYKECITACEEALKLNPKYSLAYNNICSSYNELKQWDKAVEAGTKGLAIDPNNQLLKGNLNVALKNVKK